MSRYARREAGFTLVELVVVMSIVGILMAIGAYGFTSYRNTSEHKGSSEELVSTLRAASEQAVSEGRTYCVDLGDAASGSRSYSTWQKACATTGGGTQIGATRSTQSSRVTFTTAMTTSAPTSLCPSGHACVFFYPRGTASPASVTVSSSARSKTYTIHVEGLTARVYI